MAMVYSLVYSIALAGLLPSEYLKRPAPLRKRWLRERFGSPGISVKEKALWVHAVSVGETIAAVPLVKRLRQSYPSLDIVVSTVTDTGQKIAQDRLGGIAQ
ncbi:MAG: 3-deoxy-D-manno-octulosonic acid transferase, partial [Nitrospirales bacterium]|nr:3-deoxy-D-manno-octulosonic acid transferase [Nitrospirales bacterium]